MKAKLILPALWFGTAHARLLTMRSQKRST